MWNDGTATVAIVDIHQQLDWQRQRRDLELRAPSTVTGSTFVGNSVGRGGGALDQFLAPPTSAMTLTNDIISDNTSGGDGGGVMIDSGTLTLSGGTIGGTGSTSPADLGNSHPACGGGLAVEGGSATSSGVTYGGSDSAAATRPVLWRRRLRERRDHLLHGRQHLGQHLERQRRRRWVNIAVRNQQLQWYGGNRQYVSP